MDQLAVALETVYQDKAALVEVTEFFGRDEILAHLSFACAELLSAGTAGNAKRIAAFAHLLAIHIAERYTTAASQKPDYRGGLPIARLRKIEDYVRAHLAESISIEKLAEVAELSPFHFSFNNLPPLMKIHSSPWKPLLVRSTAFAVLPEKFKAAI